MVPVLLLVKNDLLSVDVTWSPYPSQIMQNRLSIDRPASNFLNAFVDLSLDGLLVLNELRE